MLLLHTTNRSRYLNPDEATIYGSNHEVLSYGPIASSHPQHSPISLQILTALFYFLHYVLT